jgi:nicotinate-nucleotide adenylyltransferase
MRKRTIGILGVTGDPVHDGHVHGGEAALSELGLDEVWFMPSPESTAKVGQEKAPIEHRMHLTNLAVLPTGRLGRSLKVSDLEVSYFKLTGKNATADVLAHFTDMYRSLQPVWLMGADNLCEIHTWGSRWQEIMERYPVGILSRAGWTERALESVAAKQFAASRRDTRDFRSEAGTWAFVNTSHSASSTEIRSDLRAGRKPQYLTDEAYAHIQANDLYQ